MATFTLAGVDIFPEGTSVKAYPESGWPNGIVKQGAAPVGTATDTQTVTSGTLTFTGLNNGERYVAYALLGSTHRYSSFVAGSTAVGGGGGAVDSVNGQTGVVSLAAADVGAQPSDSDLTAIAALTTTSFGRAFLALADAAAGRTALGLGTSATQATGAFDAAGAAAAAQAASQPVDSDLTAIAALTTTSFGRALLALADAAALRTAAGLVIGTDVAAFGDARLSDARTPLALALLDAFGHSYPINPGPGNQSYAYPDRLAYVLGARRRNNRGWGGAVACWPTAGATGDGGFPWVLQEKQLPGSPVVGTKLAHPESIAAPYLPRSQVVLCHYGLNDLAILGSTNPRPFKEALRTIYSRLASCAVWEYTAAAWAYTGTWGTLANTTFNSGTGAKSTSTLNDKATFTVPADWEAGKVLAIGLVLNAAQDLTVGVKVNGVSQADARLQASVLCDQSVANKHQCITLRFGSGLPAGTGLNYAIAIAAADTVELTLKTQTVGSSTLYVNFAQIESDPLDGPVIVAPRPNRCVDYSIYAGFAHGPAAGTDPINDAAVATWDTAYQAVAAEFPGRMVQPDIDTSLAKAAANFQSDNAHPNGKGYGLITEAVRAAIVSSGLVTGRVLERPIPDVSPFYEPVGVAGRTAFANSWVNNGGGWPDAGFHKDLQGFVHLRGSVKSGSSAAAVIFTLPNGCRPQFNMPKPAYGNALAAATLQVSTNGTVFFLGGGSTTASYFGEELVYAPAA